MPAIGATRRRAYPGTTLPPTTPTPPRPILPHRIAVPQPRHNPNGTPPHEHLPRYSLRRFRYPLRQSLSCNSGFVRVPLITAGEDPSVRKAS